MPYFLNFRLDHAKIKSGDGWFEIEVINNSKVNKYVSKVKFNGNDLSHHKFEYIDTKQKIHDFRPITYCEVSLL